MMEWAFLHALLKAKPTRLERWLWAKLASRDIDGEYEELLLESEIEE